MGWFSKAWKKIRKVVAIVVAAVVTIATLAIAAPAMIGAAVLGSEIAATTVASVAAPVIGQTAATTILGSTTVGSVVGGAITGAATGALTSAIGGGDPLKGALGGLVGGAVGPLVGGSVSSMLGPAGAGLGQPAAQIAGRTFGSAAAGALGAAATGANVQEALRAGAIAGAGGLAGGLTTAGLQAIGAPEVAISPLSTVASSLARYGVGQAFGPQTQQQMITSQYRRAPTGAPSVSRQAPATPSTAASASYGGGGGGGGGGTDRGGGGGTTQATGRTLRPALQAVLAGATSPVAGALSIGGGLGYTPGAAVFGAGESDRARRNVWNRGSLRSLSEEG